MKLLILLELYMYSVVCDQADSKKKHRKCNSVNQFIFNLQRKINGQVFAQENDLVAILFINIFEQELQLVYFTITYLGT
jgi:hypothetical protein